MFILDEIALKTKKRIDEIKEQKSIEVIRNDAYKMQTVEEFRFEKAFNRMQLGFICEVKKASPSKGIIAEDFPYIEIAKEYEAIGANAISVLTEPFYFKGSDEYLNNISKEIRTPLLRKDFVVDEYMIYEAKLIGASAILLICAILTQEQLNEYSKIAYSLGLSVLVEAHDEKEIEMALKAEARIIGVNNRDLRDFTVDLNNSIKLRKYVPEDILYVSESGIKNAEDITRLKDNKVNIVLIGETFMRSNHKKELLDMFRGE